MKYLIQHPEPIGIERDLFDAGDVVEVARAVEAAGWDGIAYTEHPAPGYRWLAEGGGHQTLDPFVALGAVAAVTERLTLLTYLAVAPYRNPLMLAKAAASVDLISGGRFVLGMGTGYLKSEFFAVGVDFDERNEIFDEALEVMSLHWSGERFSYQGKYVNARDIIARPSPRSGTIPVWIGGNAKVSRRRAATKAQGWMPMLSQAEMASTTRTPHLGTVEDVGAAIAEIREMAGERAAELDFVLMYPDQAIIEPDTDVERHRDTLGRMAEIGITWVAFAFDFHTQAETIEFVDGFAAGYLGANRV